VETKDSVTSGAVAREDDEVPGWGIGFINFVMEMGALQAERPMFGSSEK
jgi:hypothetical protein